MLVGSIFHFGYLMAEFPANVLLQRLPVGRTGFVFACGCFTMFQGTASNAATLLVMRFLLGVAEAGIFPGATMLNTMWYSKKEQPLRSAITF